MQNDILALSQWSQVSKLSFNAKKTQLISFDFRSQNYLTDISVLILDDHISSKKRGWSRSIFSKQLSLVKTHIWSSKIVVIIVVINLLNRLNGFSRIAGRLDVSWRRLLCLQENWECEEWKVDSMLWLSWVVSSDLYTTSKWDLCLSRLRKHSLHLRHLQRR